MTLARTIVVIAEDEELLRCTAVEGLREAGFEVIEAGDAAEAIGVLQTHAAAICVLFTDIHMPGAIDGLALAHHARAHWPWVGLLVASGQARPHLHEMPEGCRFLRKPYRLGHVLSHVRDLIAAT